MTVRVRWIAVACVAIAAVAAAGVAIAQSDAAETTDRMQEAREALSKWVDTQRVISKEREQWRLQKDLLEQRIELIEGEVGVLEAKIAETEEGIGEADATRRDLQAEIDALKRASAGLADRIGALEHRTLALLKRVPEPLARRVGPLAQRIPKDASKTELSLSERFQNVIGVLNEANKFALDAYVASELRTLESGESAEVTTIYLGLGQAYYVTANGDAAGVGIPTDDGWEWSSANDLAPQVAQAIAIYNNEQVPAFVPLPVRME